MEDHRLNTYRTGWKAKFFEAKKEIERLTEELNSKTKEFELTEKALIKNVSENAELQKQVDELTKDLRRSVELLKEGGELAKMNEQIITQVYEQAVKDTAKEILTNAIEGFVFNFTADTEDYKNGYDKAIDDYDDKIKEFIKERYGVEVE